MKNRFSKRVIAIALAALFILFGSSFISLPYYVTKPGMAMELNPIIEVENGYDEQGTFMLTTVRMGKANIYTYMLAKWSEYQHIYPEDQIRNKNESEEEYNVRQLYLMSSSKQAATEVAYRAAGKSVQYTYNGVYVLNVLQEMPAEGKLEAGDRITRVDGIEFQSANEFMEIIADKTEGESITLTYIRAGKTDDVVLKLQAFPKEKTKIGVGIGLVDDKEVHVDPAVTVNTEDIGGPSAGFMFSLEIYNQLTATDITKGYRIAGTGTISPDGTIGRIGGIEQKIVAANNAGAEIFFAPNEKGSPDSNYRAAVKTAKDIHTKMKIVPVDTFSEALQYLDSLEKKLQ
ncbi:PDZ domain-containing protein [Bacillaceae bacterium Marseille-Q3522]|nr:PDZ domain-containing protein [Bacillaceae bacterium Marseille-Q3522]